MCDVHAFVLRDGLEEMVLENVDRVEAEGDIIRLVDIFGAERSLKARFRCYANRPGRLVFEAL